MAAAIVQALWVRHQAPLQGGEGAGRAQEPGCWQHACTRAVANHAAGIASILPALLTPSLNGTHLLATHLEHRRIDGACGPLHITKQPGEHRSLQVLRVHLHQRSLLLQGRQRAQRLHPLHPLRPLCQSLQLLPQVLPGQPPLLGGGSAAAAASAAWRWHTVSGLCPVPPVEGRLWARWMVRRENPGLQGRQCRDKLR